LFFSFSFIVFFLYQNTTRAETFSSVILAFQNDIWTIPAPCRPV
jgi:hypothetical protein